MYVYRIETSVGKDSSLTLERLPFKPGKEIEVIIIERNNRLQNKSYSLRGKPIRYDNPTEPVAQNDWEVIQ